MTTFLGHFIEHLVCEDGVAAFRMHIHEGASDKFIDVVGSFEGDKVEGVCEGERFYPSDRLGNWWEGYGRRARREVVLGKRVRSERD